jgi:hypothetical protein
MDEIDIKQQVIGELAEQNVPISRISTSAVLARIESQRGRQIAARRRLSLAGVSAAVIVMMLGAFFALTPAGRAAAQGILNFFVNQAGNQRPEPIVVQHESELPTAAPTQANPATTPTVEPLTVVLDNLVFDITVAQAEELAGFRVTSADAMPTGYEQGSVSYNRKTNGVTRLYFWEGKNGNEAIAFTQQTSNEGEPVGADAQIKSYKVGDVAVEGVDGSWFQLLGSNSETWEKDSPVYSYRWQQDGFTFILQFIFNNDWDPGYLDAEKRLQLVGLLAGAGGKAPVQWNLNHLSLAEAGEAAEFPVLLPKQPLAGLTFDAAVYEPETPRLVLLYKPGSANLEMRIFEVPISVGNGPIDYSLYPAGAVEQVQVGAYAAMLIRGGMLNNSYDANAGISLTWQTDTTTIHIQVYSPNSSTPPQVDKDALIAFAEGMQ